VAFSIGEKFSAAACRLRALVEVAASTFPASGHASSKQARVASMSIRLRIGLLLGS
jgi:hypothetical protein